MTKGNGLSQVVTAHTFIINFEENETQGHRHFWDNCGNGGKRK